MKGSAQHKRIVSKLRRKFGKKNGVVRGCFFDALTIMKMERCKNNYRRSKDTTNEHQ